MNESKYQQLSAEQEFIISQELMTAWRDNY